MTAPESPTSAVRPAPSMSMAFLCIAIIHSFLFTILLDKMEELKKKGVLARGFLLNAGRT